MIGRLPVAGAVVICAVAVWPAAVTAQATRTDALEQQRAEKAERLRPYEAGRIEKFLLWAERTEPLRKLAPHNGFYVDYGYQGKPTGSGLALSGGYRHDLFERRARVDLEIGASLRNYQLGRIDFALPYLLDDRLEIGAEASYRRHPQEDFYGLGPDTLKADRTSFLYKSTEFQGRVIARPTSWLEVGARAGVLRPAIGRGTDDRFPSLGERFTLPDAPGLFAEPDHPYTELFAAVDTRDQDGNPRDGSYYEISWRRYQPDDELAGFRRVYADVQQFFPIFDKKRVIALRGRITSTSASAGGDVPFYFQPTLGGSESLRSYADYRFRDRNVLVLNAEYRWEAFSGLDMALFSDWGKVAPRTRDLNLGSLKHAYGIGLRFNTYKTVFLRIDVAAGSGEGVRYFFKLSNVF